MNKLNLLPFDLSEPLLTAVRDSFDELQLDRDLEAKGIYCRSRGFSRYRVDVDCGRVTRVIPLPHQPFRQSEEYNEIFANIDRTFPPLKIDPTLHIAYVADKLGISDTSTWEAGVHQIRINATSKNPGQPVPEGWHQDGFTFVSILVINRVRVKGGKTSIKSIKKGEFLFQTTLPAGTGVVFDDLSLQHYTSEIEAIGDSGYRDVMVITFVEWEKRTFLGSFEPDESGELALKV